ncbi:MAG: PEP-CTERM sorting domain-containing protein [Phycisphaeraceae bacterium]|nr:MAG: PEP-CTERM sorting domain-containing protein [Phycisphaeraceae bacterium]
MLAATAMADTRVTDLTPSPYMFSTDQVGLRTLDAGTGFEAPDFVSGPISGQNGWTTFTANMNAPVISTANPASGAQHLRITEGPGAGGSFNGAFSPNFGQTAQNKRSITSVDIFHSDLDGADANIVGQTPTDGLTSWRVVLNFEGGIFVLDDIGLGLQFVDTGVSWTPGEYKNLKVDFDPANDAIDYYYDNALIYTGSVFGGTSVDQAILFADNFFSFAPGSFIDYDNFSIIVPTPGALALFGLAGLAGVRRRR